MNHVDLIAAVREVVEQRVRERREARTRNWSSGR